MIILRTLMEFNIVLQTGIALATHKDLRKAFFTGFSDAMFMYMNIQKIPRMILPINPSVGIVATAPVPLPGLGMASIETSIPSKDVLYNLMSAQVQSPVPLPNPLWHTMFFASLAQWLHSPTMCKIGAVSVPPTMTGTGTTMFPLMPFLGIPTWATLFILGLLGKLHGPRDTMEIMSNFIYLGLLANFTPPIATFGTAIPPAGPYSGVTLVLPWIFLDIMDWDNSGNSQGPYGPGGLFQTYGTGSARIPADMLEQLGLTGLIDEEGNVVDEQGLLDYQEELKEQPVIEQVDCNIQVAGVSVSPPLVRPTNCGDQYILEIYDTGALSDVSHETSAVNVLTSASTDNMNANMLSTSADNKVISFINDMIATIPEASATFEAIGLSADTGKVPDYSYTQDYGQVDSVSINISVASDINVRTVFVPEGVDITGLDTTSVFEAF